LFCTLNLTVLYQETSAQIYSAL